VESFNGRLRDECLNEHWFTSLFHARAEIESWRREYNDERPKKILGGLTPGPIRKAVGHQGRYNAGKLQSLALLKMGGRRATVEQPTKKERRLRRRSEHKTVENPSRVIAFRHCQRRNLHSAKKPIVPYLFAELLCATMKGEKCHHERKRHRDRHERWGCQSHGSPMCRDPTDGYHRRNPANRSPLSSAQRTCNKR
jgi:hypothetical protein